MSDSHDEEIARLRAYIAELEKALEGAVWATERDICQVCAMLRATKTEAHILVLLWKARHPVLVEAIDAAVPGYPQRAPNRFARSDPDFRRPNTIRALIHHLRRRFGREAVLTAGYNAGYFLGAGMRERLNGVLAS